MPTLLPSLDSLIESRSLLLHPFYQRWSKGQLTVEDLKLYAKEYYELVRNVPVVIGALLQHAPKDLRARLLSHMDDEVRHMKLWLGFSRALGLRESEIERHIPSTQTREAVAALVKLAKGSFLGGVAAMYALEKELPKIAQTKLEGLMRFYGLTSSEARTYFEEHLKEEEHFSFWQQLLADLVGEERKRAIRSAASSLRSQHRILDSVCRVRGITMEC